MTAIFFPDPAGAAASIGGYLYDESATVAGRELRLNGAGVRCKTVFADYSEKRGWLANEVIRFSHQMRKTPLHFPDHAHGAAQKLMFSTSSATVLPRCMSLASLENHLAVQGGR